MTEIMISTSDYVQNETRRANIDGRVYTVRKMGAGDQLDLSAASSKMVKLSKRAMEIKQKMDEAKNEADRFDIMSEMGDLTEEMTAVSAKIDGIYAGLFNDGENGEHSRALVRLLGNKVPELIEKIFEKE